MGTFSKRAPNRVIETRDVSFDTETGELTSGMCMSVKGWCDFVFHMAGENAIAKEAVQTSDSLETYLVDIWELKEGDAYWVAFYYFRLQIPDQVIADIDYEVGRNQLEYADNYRAYRLKDGLGQREFNHKRRKGCCGEFESSTVVDGDQWIIGCNHGH